MRTALKNILVVAAVAITFSLVGCQPEPIEPKSTGKKIQLPSESVQSDDEDQPPKSGNNGGNGGN
ncbi:hypothetical protein BN8_01549 [Fibrisoma limi BUZ 3]|uniref:Uncharacterized protein n=1 Tax=Fibrisoma limi BUZ 3 TaxID=1185876 RepID=I2GF65_9BACT|nr:hypothetical protein [Fibrisoma limi]CCH52540.1 hypothetical protein BN8_01549 [Fibrisoma limi BUZ 3]